MTGLLSAIKQCVLWLIRLVLLGYVAGLIIAPGLLVYELVSLEAGLLTTIVMLSAVYGLLKFGPWLIGRSLGAALSKDIENLMEYEMGRLEAKENHALAEGISW